MGEEKGKSKKKKTRSRHYMTFVFAWGTLGKGFRRTRR
jgi:hypothetical protein